MNREERADVLLVGGGVASVRCARALRRGGFVGSVSLVGRERHLPYNRPPLSKELLRGEVPDELTLAEPENWYVRRNVVVRRGAEVVALDVDRRRATLDDGSTIAFGRCLLATGAEARPPPVRGHQHAMTLRTIDDARRIEAAAPPGSRVAIIGGGFIGVEVASSLSARGVHVAVIELAELLWGGALGRELARWARELLEGIGVQVMTGTRAEEALAGGVRVGDHVVEADLVLAAVGVTPRDALAREAGLAVDDGVVTDVKQLTSAPSIWAAGDVARSAGRRTEHWHAAREAGERAALGMLGLPVPAPRAPWVFSEVAGVPIDLVGDASAWDEERWIAEASVLAFLEAGRIVQLAIVASALDPELGRGLVERKAPVEVLEQLLGG